MDNAANNENKALYDPFDADGSTTIKSLSEYIQIFELFTHNKNLAKDVHMGHFDVAPEDYPRIEGLLKPDYILRGEHSDFGDTATTSGAFRSSNHVNSVHNNSIYSDFRIARDVYYREVGHRLSTVERDNFTAFSQHHGLITNLLDVTYAPLTALFMACDKEDNNPAYVYIFEDYVDVSEIIEKHPEQNIVDLLCSQDEYAINHFFDALLKQSRQYQFRQSTLLICLKNLIDNIYMDTITAGVTYTNKEFKQLVEATNSSAKFFKDKGDAITFQDIEKLRELLEATQFKLDIKYHGMPEELAYIYVCLLVFYLRRASGIGVGHFMPYMIYRPKLTFERARLQQGFFIIQPFKSSYKSNNGITLMQNIKHSKSIRINDPLLIMQQLEFMGINRGTMYGDFDNIARHVRKNY